MATPLVYYTWKPTDNIVSVAGAKLPLSQYPSTGDLVTAIRTQNPQIMDWYAVPAGTVIIIPLIVMAS